MGRQSTVRVIVLRTAGINCDCETAYAFQKVGAQADRIHVNRVVERPGTLDAYQILALPGGFSYGDDIASGKVFANEVRFRLQAEMERFIGAGKLIIGICNGFQVLVKAGLLPRLHGQRAETTLSTNDSGRFEDRWVYLRAAESPCAFVRPGELFYLPVAHGEGKFVADEKTLRHLAKRRMVVLRYARPDGNGPVEYPWNPNGSLDDIAGICDPTGRIFGLMPHPERHIEPTHHPRWTREGLRREGDGVAIFRNAVEFVRTNLL